MSEFMQEMLGTAKEAIDGGKDEFGQIGGLSLTTFPSQRPFTYDPHIFINDDSCPLALLMAGMEMLVGCISNWILEGGL